MPLQFFLPITPPTVTHQQHRVGSRGHGKPAAVYDSPQLKDARQKFLAYLAPHRPEAPLTGAVRLVTKWCWPCNKVHPKLCYKTTRPDTDNVLKLFKDCMTRLGFWTDDAQVASEITEKFYSPTPGIFVRMEEIKL